MNERFARLSLGAKLVAIAALVALAVVGSWLGYRAGHFLGTH